MIGTTVNEVQTVPAIANQPEIWIDRFDGTSTRFCNFVKRFKMCLDDRVNVDGLYCWSYLAKEAIPWQGLLHCHEDAVWMISYRNRDMFDGVTATINVDILRRVLGWTSNSGLAFLQMNYAADLNYSPNIKRIVLCLLKRLRLEWAEVVNEVLQGGSESGFLKPIQFFKKKCW